MGRRQIAIVGLVVVAVLGAAAWAVAQGGFGGPPGPPPGGGMGGGRPGGPPGDMQAMTYLEKSWTAVTFQLECTAEQQEKLKPTYAAELQARDAAVAAALKKRDMSALQRALETCKSHLTTALKEVLTDDQREKLQQLMQASAPPPPPD